MGPRVPTSGGALACSQGPARAEDPHPLPLPPCGKRERPLSWAPASDPPPPRSPPRKSGEAEVSHARTRSPLGGVRVQGRGDERAEGEHLMGAWPLTCAVSEPSPSNSKSMSEGSGAEIAVLATGITDPKVMDAEKLEKARLSCAETTTPSQQQGSPITLRVACDRLREACELSRRELCAATSAHLPDDQQARRVSLRGGAFSLALLLESLNQGKLKLRRPRM